MAAPPSAGTVAPITPTDGLCAGRSQNDLEEGQAFSGGLVVVAVAESVDEGPAGTTGGPDRGDWPFGATTGAN